MPTHSKADTASAAARRPKLGFLGVGWIGLNRAEAIVKSGVAELTSVADPSTENAERAAKLNEQATVVTNLDALLSDASLDGIVIATPSALHAAQATAALQAGKAVFCQKPLGRTAAEVREVVAAARSNNRLLGLDLSYRHTAAMQAVRQLVQQGELGDIYAVELTFHNAYGPDKDWFYDPQLAGGGCVIDLGIHLIDLALWVLDFPEVSEVTSALFSKGKLLPNVEGQVEDFATASITTASGVHLQLSCSWNLPAGEEAVIAARFYGTAGGAAMRNVGGSFYEFRAERYNGTRTETLVAPPDEWSGRAATAWAEQLSQDNGFLAKAEQFVAVAEVIDRIYKRSAATSPDRPTVLMTADAMGGIWTYALDLIASMPELNVVLATMGNLPTQQQREEAAALANLTLRTSEYPLEWMDEPWTGVDAAGEWLQALAKEFRPTVIHLNGMTHAALPWQQPVVVVLHSCVLSWWEAVHGEAAPARYDEYRQRVTAGVRAADVVVAPTAGMLAAAAKHYGPLPRGQVIYNGAAPAGKQAQVEVPQEPFIFAVGRVWDEAKNLRLLAEVAPQLPWPVFIAGDTTHPVSGQQLQLEGVQLLGVLPKGEIAQWLNAASIYVHPARYEPFGLSVLEAALANCALLVGDIATLREIWGEAASYVAVDSAAALRAQLHALIQDEHGRRELAAKAAHLAGYFTTSRQAQQYKMLYQHLISSPLTPSTTT